jgi:hypothetical protein
MLSELKRIMSAAKLDNTYRVVDWFMKRDRLFVHVASRARKIDRGLDSPSKRIASWIRRLFAELR